MMANAAGRISFHVEGTEATIKAFYELKNAAQKKHLARGITKACRVVRAAARTNAPKETGALKKSMGFVIRRYPTSVIGVVGPMKGSVRMAVRGKSGKMRLARKGETGTQRRAPALYAHLVEWGHRIAKGGTLNRVEKPGKRTPQAAKSKRTGVAGGGAMTGRVEGTRPVTRAYESTKGQAIAIIQREMVFGIEEEARKRGLKQ